MRQTYRVLSGLIALGVIVQAMAIAFGFFTVGHDIDQNGKVLNKDNLESYSPLGLSIHAFMGFTLIPLLAIVLFIFSFFAAKAVSQAVKWAGFVLIAVVLQVTFAIIAFSVPAIGLLHGLNAFVVLGTAALASRRASGAPTAAVATDRSAAAV